MKPVLHTDGFDVKLTAASFLFQRVPSPQNLHRTVANLGESFLLLGFSIAGLAYPDAPKSECS